jgi:peptidoglycan/LPS O-acetylase OafA/YrhL
MQGNSWRGQLERHTDPLAILRGLLAVAIIWHHMQPEPIESMALGGRNLFFLISFPGRISVWLFLVLSGYSIYYGYRTGKYGLGWQETLRFYFNRAIRILPLLYATVLSKWILLLYLSPKDLPPPGEIARTLLLLDLNMHEGIFAFTSTWVIAILVQFYLLAPVLVRGYRFLYRKAGPWVSAVSLIGVAIACHHLGRAVGLTYDIRNIVGCVPLFLFGFLACDLLQDRKDSLRNFIRRFPAPVIWAAVIVLFEAAFFLYCYHFDKFLTRPMEAYVGSLGTLLIVLLLLGEGAEAKTAPTGWSMRFLSSLGQLSYGLYLWHGSVIALFIRSGFLPLSLYPHPTPGSLVLTFAAVTALTYLVSLFFYHVLERPYHLLYRDGGLRRKRAHPAS